MVSSVRSSRASHFKMYGHGGISFYEFFLLVSTNHTRAAKSTKKSKHRSWIQLDKTWLACHLMVKFCSNATNASHRSGPRICKRCPAAHRPAELCPMGLMCSLSRCNTLALTQPLCFPLPDMRLCAILLINNSCVHICSQF